MICGFHIVTRNGVVLWKHQFDTIRGDPVNNLIRDVLMAEKTADPKASVDGYSFRWKFSNSLDLIYIVCYQGHVVMSNLQELLEGVSAAFETRYAKSKNSIDKLIGTQIDFLSTLEKISEVTLGGSGVASVPKSISELNLGGSDVEGSLNNSDAVEAPKAVGGRRTGPRPFEKKQKDKKEGESKTQIKRDWSEFGIIDKNKLSVSQREIDQLDMGKQSGHNSGNQEQNDAEARRRARLYHGIDDETERVIGEESESEDEGASSSSSAGLITSTLRKILPRALTGWMGSVALTEEEIDEALQGFEKKLMSKNVARDVAIQIANSVRASLIGTTTDAFQSAHAAVRTALAEAVRKVLTPKKSVDVLRMALAAKAKGKVFSLCFIGTNGVGKSTNLAKVAYYLQHRGGLKVLIAACDTFRSGAVEQLRTHARNLDATLFERGYGKDASGIAEEALQLAKKEGYDVVLIDTAGRMQDNEPLMTAIAKLVSVNQPDLVLFVGEALVGNDAIDQLVKFNSALRDRSHPARGVDGILLTKFDTVDDKVGAALTMVAATGQPIVFVGTGQKYPHLRKLHVSSVVDALMN